MKKLIFATAGRMLVLGLTVAFFSACSDEADLSQGTAQRDQTTQNFFAAIERMNAPENAHRRSGETDAQANERRIMLLLEDSKNVLLSNGWTPEQTETLSPAEIVSEAFETIYKQTH